MDSFFSLSNFQTNNMRKSFTALLCLVVFSIFFSNCSKPSNLGLGLVGDDLLDFETTDTVSVLMEVVPGDTVITSGRDLGSGSDYTRYFVGNYQDNDFGKTNASTYFNFYLERVNPDFTGATIDSMILVLPYDSLGHYGNTTQSQSWDVLRLAEDLDKNTTYYSNKSFNTSATIVSNFTFVPKPLASVNVKDTAGVVRVKKPHIRIPLGNAMGTEFLTAPAGTFSSLTNFKAFFKGIHVKPSATSLGNGLLRLNLTSSDSKLEKAKIELYYTQNSKKKIFKFEYNPSQPNTAVGRYIHDYTGANTFNNGPTDSLSFVKGAGGCVVKVSFPGASSSTFDRIVINKAELILQSPIVRDQAITPDAGLISVLYKKTGGVYELIKDFQLNSYLDTSGGGRENVINGRGLSYRYKFNISTHFQRIIDAETPENSIYLRVSWNLNPLAIGNENANTAIFANHKSTGLKPKLKITYTKY
jgi:Domain of unknown function (DUF4270)